MPYQQSNDRGIRADTGRPGDRTGDRVDSAETAGYPSRALQVPAVSVTAPIFLV